jgi:hypothetical protein
VTSSDIPDEIGGLLASLAEQTPSNSTTEVINAALAVRPNQPIQMPPSDDEVAMFLRAVDDVQTTIGQLEARHWTLPAVNGLTVGELVGHLIGAQQAMAAELGIAAPVSDSKDHVEMTRAAIAATAVMDPLEAARRFAAESLIVAEHLRTLDDAGLAAPARVGLLRADVRFLLIGRVFELWTHDNDLRSAVGWVRVEPDPDRLWMMTRTIMPLIGRLGGRGVRVVLTGAGGGVWESTAEEAAEIVVDAVAFCRRAANRISIDEIGAGISGDLAVGTSLLMALTVLALD